MRRLSSEARCTHRSARGACSSSSTGTSSAAAAFSNTASVGFADPDSSPDQVALGMPALRASVA